MQIDELVKWGTFSGAVVAGITGSYTLYLKFREGCQRIRVGLGPVAASISPATEMHVINYGTSKVVLRDYGFVELDGTLFSALIESALEPQAWGGKFSNKLEPFEHLCVGCEGYKKVLIGAYAISAINGEQWFNFSPDIRLWRRLWFVCRIKWKGSDAYQ